MDIQEVGWGGDWIDLTLKRTRDGYLAYAVKEIQLPRNVVIPWLAEELLDSKKDPTPWSQLLSTIHTYIVVVSYEVQFRNLH